MTSTTTMLRAPAILATSLLSLACFQFPATDDGEATFTPGNSTGISTSDGGSSTTSSSTTSASTAETTTSSSDSSSAADVTTGPVSICGDGMVDADEACDDGNRHDGDACTNDCIVAICGDGIKADDEGCDDGNMDDTDLCSSACEIAVCGDGVVQTGEMCDAAGVSPDCDADCTLVVCGDHVLNLLAGERCDDGRNDPGDACSPSCEAMEIASIAAGEDVTCIAFMDGRVRCWGRGDSGALGGGDSDDLGKDPMGQLPVPDINVGGKVMQLSSGSSFVCARLDTKEVRCWGRNNVGQLGIGKVPEALGDEPGEMPTAAVDLGGDVLHIATGQDHACAIVATGKVRCWGYGLHGRLGYGDNTNVSMPSKDVPGIEDARQLALGFMHSCVLQQDGTVRCWGGNGFGQLGLGHTSSIGDQAEETPQIVSLGGLAVDIAAGYYHTCARMEAGQVRCWGYGIHGQLGTGSANNLGDDPLDVMPPADVELGPGAAVEQVVAGGSSTCARLDTGKVKCWGSGANGALGSGNTANATKPQGFVQLGDGADVRLLGSHLGSHTCALLADYTLRCWGGNTYGQLGYGHVYAIGDNEVPGHQMVPVDDNAGPNRAGPVPF